ncbi:sugar ABC transporter permease [Phycicoccus sp. SLBN-51]|uniref:carbohydrate ABC transporter permease n=1 Tax=Phycicoccus sp. SLBN-51 TaxID=2768447 RepID=UPI00114F24D6|nr:sugar ABC transporter permease [Phycicoccus sp. SLBN-51]TQJ50434.1 carbohydrate ABC transporter membrane protein 1 (CUT1 family) [Phycicoccus sp. SLBN-51]
MSTTATQTAPPTRSRKRGPKSLNAGQGRRGVLLVTPTLILLAIVILYPLVRAVIMSFQKDSGLDPATGMFSEGGFAGTQNYQHWLLQQCAAAGGTTQPCPPGTLGSQFYDALFVTLFFTVVTVFFEIGLGLWFATIMNRTFKGRGLVRAAILIPWAIPTAVTAKLWFFIFAYEGIANKLLGFVGVKPLLWTGDAWPARFAVIIADVWKTTPFMALLILAGLQLISSDVYEAAQIDGASKWQTFTRITLPLIKVPLMVAILFRTLDVLRIYDLPAILTNGGGGTGHATTTLSILVINQIRAGFNSASALSTLVFLLIAFVAFIFVRFLGADVVQRPPGKQAAKRRWFRRQPVAAEGE